MGSEVEKPKPAAGQRWQDTFDGEVFMIVGRAENDLGWDDGTGYWTDGIFRTERMKFLGYAHGFASSPGDGHPPSGALASGVSGSEGQRGSTPLARTGGPPSPSEGPGCKHGKVGFCPMCQVETQPVPVIPRIPPQPSQVVSAQESVSPSGYASVGNVSALQAIQARKKPEPYIPGVDDWDLLPDVTP